MYRAAIIGCGAIHALHANALRNNPHAQLAAVVDIIPYRAEDTAEVHNCDYYVDYRDVLKDPSIDVVHLCTPHHLHYPMAMDALDAGKHVLTEKPIAIRVSEADAMIQKATAAGLRLGVTFQNRYNPNARRAKELLEQGALGEVRGVKGLVIWHRNESYYNSEDWRGSWDLEGGGVVINQAIHTVDLMQWLGGPITAVSGQIATHNLGDHIDVEDMASGVFRYANGASGIFFATNDYSTNAPVEVEIHGTKGFLLLRGEDLILNGELVDIAPTEGQKVKHKSYWGLGHQDLVDGFYAALAANNDNFVAGADGRSALAVVQALYQSALKGRAVNL